MIVTRLTDPRMMTLAIELEKELATIEMMGMVLSRTMMAIPNPLPARSLPASAAKIQNSIALRTLGDVYNP